jgi:hypothetical protein
LTSGGEENRDFESGTDPDAGIVSRKGKATGAKAEYCFNCKLKNKCTTNKRGRRVNRPEEADKGRFFSR